MGENLNLGSFVFTATAIVGGALLGRWLWFTASALVVPMVLALTLSLADVFSAPHVPQVLQNAGYAATGLMVGLAFTRASVRRLLGLMPLALLQVVLRISGCLLVGLAFAQATDLSPLDGYLATSPGGLPAVAAVAVGSGAAVGVVMAMQLVRVVAAILLASILAAIMRRRRRGS